MSLILTRLVIPSENSNEINVEINRTKTRFSLIYFRFYFPSKLRGRTLALGVQKERSIIGIMCVERRYKIKAILAHKMEIKFRTLVEDKADKNFVDFFSPANSI